MTVPTITIVIGQCLQRSFLSPLSGPDPRLKPCHLHAGYANAIRLLGGGPQDLPNVLEDFLWHVHGGEDGTVPGSEYIHVVYVDDEHIDDGSELAEQHFAQFGRHCVPGEVDERGVEGYLGTGRTTEWRNLRNGRTHVVRTPGLNDNMYGTGFIPVLISDLPGGRRGLWRPAGRYPNLKYRRLEHHQRAVLWRLGVASPWHS